MMKKRFIFIITAIIIMAAIPIALASSYVGNINSGKFHYSDCNSVGRMNPNNKVYFNTRDEAISAGYTPCKRCNP